MHLSKLAFAICSAFAITNALPTHNHVAESPQRTFVGFSPTEGVEAFLGIPYAQPPVNERRFQAPEAITLSNDQLDQLDCTKFGPVCYQFHVNTPMRPENWAETSPQGEDCLNINIWRPTWTTCSKELPVMIWVYGGAFAEGGSSAPIYNPQNFVKNNPEVIVVTFDYRLNIFGFPTIRNSSVTHNVGLLDIRLAIEWVRDNIDTFGGSAQKITLFGESAGAVAVDAYNFAYKEDPIARGIILESRVATGMGDASPLLWDVVAANVGCKDDGSAEGKEREVQCMKTIPAEQLKNGVSNMTINTIATPNGGGPVVDNVTVFTAAEYLLRAQQGDFAKLPALVGSNDKEGDGVINFSPEFGLNKTLSDLVTLGLCQCPISQRASSLHENNVPVWRYRYMPIFPVVTFYDFVGAYHASEIPMILGSYPFLKPMKQPLQTEIDASKLLQRAWTTFARNPRSGLETEMQWPIYNPTEPTLVQLFPNSTLDVELGDPELYDRGCVNVPMLSWDEIGAPAPSSPPVKP